MDEFGTQSEAQMTPPSTGAPTLVGQWSWAGFVFNWLYLIGHNNVGLGVGLLIAMIVLGWIPFLNLLIFLGVMLFVAIKGHEYAWSSGTYKNAEEFTASQRVLNTMGKVAFFIWLIGSVVFAILWFTMFAAMFAAGMAGAGGMEGAFPSG